MQKQLFNTGWSFQKGVGGGMFAALMGGAATPEAVDLPHDAMVRTPRRADAPSGGGAAYFELGDYTYEKHFTLDDPSLVYLLGFEGAYQNAMVYLNGSYLGQHAYGYGGFVLDATGRVRAAVAQAPGVAAGAMRAVANAAASAAQAAATGAARAGAAADAVEASAHDSE